jgi:uncharacterized protein
VTAADRDRDASGRARNARPRDASGRPLPRGTAGVSRVPDDAPALPPSAALAEAQRLLDAGRPFNAHEILEAVWKAAPDGERALWRGLAQLAVGLTHLQRGNRTGAAALLRRGAAALVAYGGGRPYDVAVDDLVAAAESAADRLDAGDDVTGVGLLLTVGG